MYYTKEIEKYKNIMLGGKNTLQIDKTFIYKGNLILSPSQIYDLLPNCTWLIGIIEENTKRIYLEAVKNKTIKKSQKF
jgi:hypothetical protein